MSKERERDKEMEKVNKNGRVEISLLVARGRVRWVVRNNVFI